MKTRLWLREDCGPATLRGFQGLALEAAAAAAGKGGNPWPPFLPCQLSFDQMIQNFKLQRFSDSMLQQLATYWPKNLAKCETVFPPDQMSRR